MWSTFELSYILLYRKTYSAGIENLSKEVIAPTLPHTPHKHFALWFCCRHLIQSWLTHCHSHRGDYGPPPRPPSLLCCYKKWFFGNSMPSESNVFCYSVLYSPEPLGNTLYQECRGSRSTLCMAWSSSGERIFCLNYKSFVMLMLWLIFLSQVIFFLLLFQLH